MSNYVFFWSGPFSNWHPSSFVSTLFENQYQFNCAEQYMMLSKALFFEDQNTADKIMLTTNPREQKALGRSVKNFNEPEWAKARFGLFLPGLYAKFYQNKNLQKNLVETGNKIIVEASPYDTVWGIGMGETHPEIENETKWKGQNLLGKALMSVRTRFLENV